MAFVFEVDKSGHVRPKIRCDSCGGTIENYADGVAIVDSAGPAPGTIVEPIFRCTHCEEEAEKSGPSRRSMRIDHFMLYVLNNIQLTPKALEDAGQRMKSTMAL